MRASAPEQTTYTQHRRESGTLSKRPWQVVKEAIGAVVFLALFALIFLFISPFFINDSSSYFDAIPDGAVSQYQELQQLPRDSIDVLFIGASSMHRAIVNPELYRAQGISSASLTIDNTQPYALKPMLDYVLERQHPKLVVLSLNPYIQEVQHPNGYESTPTFNAALERNVDAMPFSQEKLALTKATLYYYETQDTYGLTHNELAEGDLGELNGTYYFKGINIFSLYLSLLRTHNNWPSLSSFNFLPFIPDHYVCLRNSSPGLYNQGLAKQPKNKAKAYDLSTTGSLASMLDYLHSLGIGCLLLDPPRGDTNREATFDYSAYGVKDIQLCENAKLTKDLIGLDYNTDFWNQPHLNYYGALKVTRYLGTYLKRNYALPDRRGQQAYRFLASELTEYDTLFKPQYDRYMAEVAAKGISWTHIVLNQ